MPDNRKAGHGLAVLLVACLMAAALVVTTTSPATGLSGSTRVAVPALPEGNQRFVDAAYRDLLDRYSETSGRNYWVGLLDAGLPRSDVTYAMSRSPEWTEKLVQRLWPQILDRQPDAGGLQYWAGQLRTGSISVSGFTALLFGSPEFAVLSGSTSVGFVDQLYRRTMYRAPTTAEQWIAVAQLNEGTARSAVALRVFRSVEANALRVDDLYQQLLSRQPDAGGRKYWAEILVTHDDLMLAAFLAGSAEYFSTAQDRVVTGSVEVPATTATPPASSVTAVSTGATPVVTASANAVPIGSEFVAVPPGSAAPEGYLGEVESRTANPNGTVIVTTTPARWDEAFSSGEFSGSIDLLGSSSTGPPPAAQDRQDRAGNCKTDSGMSIDSSTDVRLDVKAGWGPFTDEYLRVRAQIDLSVKAKMVLGGEVHCEFAPFAWTIPFSIGPIPFTAQVRPAFTVDGKIGATLEATLRASCGVGVEWRNGQTTNLTGCSLNTGTGATFSPQNVSASLTAQLSGRVAVKAFGTLGVELAGGPTVTATVAPLARPWWTVDAGAKASLALKADLWILHAQVDLGTVTCCTRRLASGTGEPPPPPPPPLAMTTTALPDGTVGQPYTATLTATGGRPPYSWTATPLPPGLVLTGNTITGTPTTAGSTTTTITLRDTTGNAAAKTVTQRIIQPPDDSTTRRVTNGDSHSYGPASVSGDGRYITFSSYASNLFPDDTNGAEDVFVWDRSTGTTTRITNGNGTSSEASVSGDGRYITFTSWASNLVPGDTNMWSDVFVWDRSTGTTTRITNGNSNSHWPSVSADGRYIAFKSRAPNPFTGHPNMWSDVFVWDRSTGTTTRITNGNSESHGPSVSADGRYITFSSHASNLVPGDTEDGQHDVFVWDRSTGTTTRITNGITNGDNHSSYEAPVSGDGRYITFTSYASNLVPGDTNMWSDVFVWDRSTGTTTRITNGNNGSLGPVVSGDGHHITFYSSASNLVPGDTNGTYDVFVWDRSTGTTTRITNGNDGSGYASVSGDGSNITFTSWASNLVPGDTNGWADVFVWER